MTVPRRTVAGLTVAALALLPGLAWGHGEEGEEAELEALAAQPARVLAQQALAMLEVSGDEVEAGERLEAAALSEDQQDVDVGLVDEAMEALEAGDHEQAVSLLDTALSRPLGAQTGKTLHEAGRAYRPGAGTQEVVGIVAGVALLLLGAWTLRPRPSGAAT